MNYTFNEPFNCTGIFSDIPLSMCMTVIKHFVWMNGNVNSPQEHVIIKGSPQGNLNFRPEKLIMLLNKKGD